MHASVNGFGDVSLLFCRRSCGVSPAVDSERSAGPVHRVIKQSHRFRPIWDKSHEAFASREQIKLILRNRQVNA